MRMQEKLLEATETDIQDLKQSIAARIEEGRGETLFEIGLEGTAVAYRWNIDYGPKA